MNLYLITYDLREPGRNYGALYNAIKACGNTLHPLESAWLLGTQMTAGQVRDALVKHIDQNDRLLILQCGPTAAWRGLSISDSATLKTSIERAA